MKELMLRKERNLIDVGRKPILAIDKISQPIMDKLKDAVELQSFPYFEENMVDKQSLNQQIAFVKQQIFDLKLDQINLAETISDQRDLLGDFKNETIDLCQRQEQIQIRKNTMHSKMELITGEFIENTAQLRKRLRETTKEVIELKTIRDKRRDDFAFLMSVRGQGPFKYESAIMAEVKKMEKLVSQYEKIHIDLYGFGTLLGVLYSEFQENAP